MKRLLSLAILLCFVIAPLPTGAQNSFLFAFVVVGDTGCGCDAQEEVANRMTQWHKEKPFDTVLMVGDNIYGKSFSSKGGDRDLFSSRFDKYYKELLSSGVKFYAALGNHDLETNAGRDEISDKRRFNILGENGYYSHSPNVSLEGEPLIEFFVVNSPSIVGTGPGDPDQIAWLSKSLTASKARWKIALFHHPLYAPEGGHEPNLKLRDELEKVFTAAGVRITFAGHNHYYARMKPQHDIVHFVAGGGGRSLKTPKANAETAVATKSYHFLYLEVYPDNINFWAIPPSGPPIDLGAIALKAQ